MEQVCLQPHGKGVEAWEKVRVVREGPLDTPRPKFEQSVYCCKYLPVGLSTSTISYSATVPSHMKTF